MVSLLTDYTESVLAKGLDKKTLIAKFQYLPDLNTLKRHLDDIAAKPFEDGARQQRLREQFADREKYKVKNREFYTGPIEDVRPGDILSYERLAEYDKFMREKKGIQKVKHWTATEDWQDNGMRPFEVKLPESPKNNSEENPFE